MLAGMQYFHSGLDANDSLWPEFIFCTLANKQILHSGLKEKFALRGS